MAATGRRLYEAGLIAASDGNLSVRLDERHLLVTPAGVPKGQLRPHDMVVVDWKGRPVSIGQPSSELGMHLVVYERRPDVQAAIHAHPPWAIAASIVPASFELVPEAVVALGGVAKLAYARPGTAAVGDEVRQFVNRCNSFLLTRHGSLTLGASLAQAFERLEALEHNARIALLARLGGEPLPLPAEEVAALRGGGQAREGARRRRISDEDVLVRRLAGDPPMAVIAKSGTRKGD